MTRRLYVAAAVVATAIWLLALVKIWTVSTSSHTCTEICHPHVSILIEGECYCAEDSDWVRPDKG